MDTKRFYLYENNDKVYFDLFLCDSSPSYSDSSHPFMLICPGGGYGACSPREAEPIARYYMGKGYNTGILYYTVNTLAYTQEHTPVEMIDKESTLPLPLIEVAKCISMVRDNAEEWHVSPDKISIIGFSAGAHLAGMLATMWNRPELIKKLGKDNTRPDALILIYPVVTSGEFAHTGSFMNLLNTMTPSKEKLEEYSLENNVNETTPPTFLVHTAADTIVPCENSMIFAKALRKFKIPFELHILPDEQHGMSLATSEVLKVAKPYNARWADWSCKWLEKTFNKE